MKYHFTTCLAFLVISLPLMAGIKTTTIAGNVSLKELRATDSDQDGTLTSKELKKSFGRKKMYQILLKADRDGNKSIDRNELAEAFSKNSKDGYFILSDMNMNYDGEKDKNPIITSDPNDVVIIGTKF